MGEAVSLSVENLKAILDAISLVPDSYNNLLAVYDAVSDEIARLEGTFVSNDSGHGKCIAPSGYHFQNGEELRLHLNEGGFIQVDGRDKWYRACANKQEVLYGTHAEWEPSKWDWDDMASHMQCIACDEPRPSKEIRARDEAEAESNGRRHARKFDLAAKTGMFAEKQMLHRSDDCADDGITAMHFHVFNEQNKQVVFAMTCGNSFQSRSLGLMEAAKLHAALGIWLDQASREAEIAK